MNNAIKKQKALRSHHCTSEGGVVNPCSNEMYKEYYLILSFKYILLRSSPLRQFRPQQTESRELCAVGGEFRRLGETRRKVWSYLFNGDVHSDHLTEQQLNL